MPRPPCPTVSPSNPATIAIYRNAKDTDTSKARVRRMNCASPELRIRSRSIRKALWSGAAIGGLCQFAGSRLRATCNRRHLTQEVRLAIWCLALARRLGRNNYGFVTAN